MANTFKLISSVNITSSTQAYIEFASIPQTYTDLQLYCSLRADSVGGGQGTNITINGSIPNKTIYYYASGQTGNSPLSGSDTASGIVGFYNGTLESGSVFAYQKLYFPNYTSSNYKVFNFESSQEMNGNRAYSLYGDGERQNTAAITTIRLTPYSGSWVQNSTVYLYGIKNS